MNSKIKILYVDDEEINVELFDINFSASYEVYTALSGEEGLKTLDEQPDIRIVITDLKIPGMNGFEFIQKARAKYSNIKFFVLTGYDINEEIKKSIASGDIVDSFTKPFNTAEIHSAIESSIT